MRFLSNLHVKGNSAVLPDRAIRGQSQYFIYRPRILIGFWVLQKLVRLIKMCLTETYSGVRVGKNLSDMFPMRNGLKQGDALSPLLFNFPLEYAIRRVQVNQDGLKLNDTPSSILCR